MVTIEGDDDNSTVGSRQFQPGIGTQDAASALMSFGFGAASGEQQLTPKQIFKQSQEKKHRYFNALAGDIQGMSDEEDEDEMIDLMTGWNEGEQLARQGQVASPMRNTTSETNHRRVTLSNQKQKTVVRNPYKKNYTTPTILTQHTAPGALAVRVHDTGKENPVSTVVSKRNQRLLPLQRNGNLESASTAVGPALPSSTNMNRLRRTRSNHSSNGLAHQSAPVPQQDLPTTKTNMADTASSLVTTTKTPTAASIRAYAINIKKDTNAGGIFTKQQQGMVKTANKNTKPYTNRTNSLEEQFFRILVENTNGKDELLHNMCTQTVFIERTLTDDRLFYKILAGEKEESKRLVLNRCCNIYTLNIKNTRTKQPLDFTTQNQYLKQVFNIFHLKGIEYSRSDFYGDGGLLGVVKQDYENKLEKDNTLGTGRTKAEFDQEGEMKYQAALRDGKLKPYDNDTDLIRCMIMGLGMKCGFRGRKEIAMALWNYFDFSIIETGPNKGLTLLSARPGGGWDKSHRLGISNGNTRTQKPSLEENRLDPNCLVKLLLFYRKACDTKQKRLLCYPKNSRLTKIRFKASVQVGEKKVLEHVRYVAQLCNFTDFEIYATHDNRHQCATAIYSNPNIPDQQKLDHMRHRSMKVASVYTHANKVTQAAVQNSLHFGLNTAEDLFPEAAGEGKQAATIALKPEAKAPIEQKQEDTAVESKPVIANDSKPVAIDEAVVDARGMKRNRVCDDEHITLKSKYKRLKKANITLTKNLHAANQRNTKIMEEVGEEKEEMSSITEELNKKYEVLKNEGMEMTLKLRMKTLELDNVVSSFNEKKKENIILKGENTQLKQELQRTKDELKERETEQRMRELIQQSQPKCAIM